MTGLTGTARDPVYGVTMATGLDVLTILAKLGPNAFAQEAIYAFYGDGITAEAVAAVADEWLSGADPGRLAGFAQGCYLLGKRDGATALADDLVSRLVPGTVLTGSPAG